MSAATAANGYRAVADEEQNAPVAILDHRLDQRARQVERTVENHAPDQLPIRVAGFSERYVRPDRGVVDQDVDPAKLGQGSGGQRLDLGLFADVGEYSDRFDAKIPDLTRDGFSLLLIGACVDNDMRAFAGQLQHGRSTDIAPRSGDQRDLPFELAHAPILLQCLHRAPPLGYDGENLFNREQALARLVAVCIWDCLFTA